MNQVRKYALAYLSREISLENFLDWLADATSPVVDLGLQANEKLLAGEIELPAAELTSGHIAEDAFRMTVHSLVTNTKFIFYREGASAIPWQTGTTARVIAEPLRACA